MPNLVMISIDDLFSVNAWPEFAAVLQTPNLDAFAAQSTNFTNAYAPVALCNPSRSAVLSGHSPLETGIVQNLGNVFEAVPADDILFQRLADAGYEITMGGKVFHNRYDPAMDSFVTNYLADDGFRVDNTIPSQWNQIEGISWGASGDVVLGDDVLTQSVLDFLAQPHGDPFVLAAGLFRPHADWIVPQRFFDMYDPATIEVPYFGDDQQGEADFYYAITGSQFHQQVLTEGAWVELIHAYLAAVSYADYLFGLMIDAIEASPYAADTSIVVWSDHGYHLGDHGVWGKFTLWEESGRAPLLIHTPGQTEGQVVDTPVSLEDIYPTVLDLMGVTDGFRGAGHSLISFLTGTGTYEGNGAYTWMYGGYSYRLGDYRYIHEEDGTEHLYNIATDLHQKVDLIADPASADVLAAMRAALPTIPGHDLFIGGSGNDVLTGTVADDILIAGAGHDKLTGGAGNDTYYILGDATIQETATGGTDTVVSAELNFVAADNIEILISRAPTRATVTGNASDNVIFLSSMGGTVFGGDGNDTIKALVAADILHGGNGNDTIDAQQGNDIVFGDGGNDDILGSLGNDELHGGAGNDRIDGGANDDTIYGDGGDDVILGGPDNDVLDGGDGIDQITGSIGDDIIYGGLGADTLAGGLGSDTLSGGGDDDHMTGDGGADTLNGDGGNDTIDGGVSGDRIYGGTGNDTVTGGDGRDMLFGQGGADDLIGGTGNDRIVGGGGSDRVHLDMGSDTAIGSGGRDTFVLDTANGADTISDFVQGTDLIDLSVMGYASFADLRGHCSQAGANVLVDLGNGATLTIANMTLEALTAADFGMTDSPPAIFAPSFYASDPIW